MAKAHDLMTLGKPIMLSQAIVPASYEVRTGHAMLLVEIEQSHDPPYGLSGGGVKLKKPAK